MMRGEGQELLNDVGCICEENGALDLLQVVVGKGDVYDGIWTELQKDHASLQAEIGYLLQNQQKFDVNLNVRHFGKVTESTIQADGTLMDADGKDLPRHNRLCARFGRFRRSRDRTGIAARR